MTLPIFRGKEFHIRFYITGTPKKEGDEWYITDKDGLKIKVKPETIEISFDGGDTYWNMAKTDHLLKMDKLLNN